MIDSITTLPPLIKNINCSSVVKDTLGIKGIPLGGSGITADTFLEKV